MSALAQAPNPAGKRHDQVVSTARLSAWKRPGAVVTAQVTATTRITDERQEDHCGHQAGTSSHRAGRLDRTASCAPTRSGFSRRRARGSVPDGPAGQTMTNATVEQVLTGATVQQVGGGQHAGNQADVPRRRRARVSQVHRPRADAPGGRYRLRPARTEFEVPRTCRSWRPVPGDATMLKPGTKVSITATEAADARRPRHASQISQ